MFFRRLLLFLVLSSVLLTSVAAQQRNQKPKGSSKAQPGLSEEAEQLRLSAISLLHSLAQNANEIDKVEDRVRVLAEIGDAFWLADSEYGRTVLLRSFKEIDKLSPAANDYEKEQVASQKRYLRQTVLSHIAKRDLAFAKQLIEDQVKETPTLNERADKLYGVGSPNAEVLLGLAHSFIATDPKRAAAIALYSVKDGLSQRFRYFLIHLSAKDSGAADGLVAAAVTELSRQHPGNLFDVLMLWDYAYQPADFYFNGISWSREYKGAGVNAPSELKRLVLNYALTTIVENLQQLPKSESTQDRNLVQMQLGALHSVIQQLLPSMQADFPRGAADLQQALVRVEQEINANGETPPQRPPSENSDEGKTTVEKWIENASEAPQGEERDNLYLAAALQLFWSGQYERAKELAARIDDQERRAMILEPLNFVISADLVEKKNLQEAWNVANQLKTTEYRICALARIGRVFLETGDAQSGMQALTAAQSLISKADPSFELVASTLRVAAAFSKTDQVRISEGIALGIQVMNKVKSDETPWRLLDSVSEEDSLLVDAKYMSGGSRLGVGVSIIRTTLPQAGGFVDVLSRLEFNDAIQLAKTVNRKPIAMIAQASICRRVIESSHKEAQKVQKSN